LPSIHPSFLLTTPGFRVADWVCHCNIQHELLPVKVLTSARKQVHLEVSEANVEEKHSKTNAYNIEKKTESRQTQTEKK
jgi:hypothetical protein